MGDKHDPRSASLRDPPAKADVGPLAAGRDPDGFHRPESLPPPVASVRGRHRHARLPITETEMGWVYSAFLLGYVLFMVPGGWLVDRRSGKAALVVPGSAPPHSWRRRARAATWRNWDWHSAPCCSCGWRWAC